MPCEHRPRANADGAWYAGIGRKSENVAGSDFFLWNFELPAEMITFAKKVEHAKII
jgi:hypothetical protein